MRLSIYTRPAIIRGITVYNIDYIQGVQYCGNTLPDCNQLAEVVMSLSCLLVQPLIVAAVAKGSNQYQCVYVIISYR